MDVPWHEWMCPIGPVLHGVGYKSSNLYMQFSVCWGDILGAMNVPKYMDRYLDFYEFLVDVHKLGVPIMACCDVHMMVMRWIHVIASIGIHIQVLEKTNKCIGGNWDSIIDRAHRVNGTLASILGVNHGVMTTIADQLSMKSIDPAPVTACGNFRFKNAYKISDSHCK